MSAIRIASVIAVSFLMLSACGRDEAKTGASSADSHAPGTTLATVAGPCSSYAPGSPGVVRTFCGGPAVVKVNVGGADYVLKGGTCENDGGIFALNLGVIAGPELGGPRPDYVGLTAPATPSHFTNAVLEVTVGGKGYGLKTNSGDLTAKSGTFEGTSYGDGTKVTGSFTC